MSRLVQVCIVAILIACLQIISAAPWIDHSDSAKAKRWKFEHSDWKREQKPDVDGGLSFIDGNLYFTPANKDSKPPTVIESDPHNKLAGGVNPNGTIVVAVRPDPGPNAHYNFDLKDGVIYH
ncbi:uncharacterized protein LOC115440293 [Manduca sexta]|uniref:uncharacterized protein LOC115440293 n=1 Tax=Manduca sexta TaxID=7130 RepID=UPI00188F2819|nr:uncharacterized protein LOC115440293 [Manduca sexta]